MGISDKVLSHMHSEDLGTSVQEFHKWHLSGESLLQAQL